MSVPDFLFTMTLSSRDAFSGMLGEVAATVFRQVGCDASVAVSLLEELNAAVGHGTAGSETFDVQFRARAGQCDVVVLVRSREVWRASREIP